MIFPDEQILHLSSQIERLNVRLKRLELGQSILVIASKDLDDLSTKSGYPHSDCLHALREVSGNLNDALSFLKTKPPLTAACERSFSSFRNL